MKNMVILALVVVAVGWFVLDPICSSFGRIGEREAQRYATDNRNLAKDIPIFPAARLLEESENDCEGAYRHDAGSACFLNRTYETRRGLSEVLAFHDDFFEADGWDSKYPADSIYRLYTRDAFRVQISPVGLSEFLAQCPDSVIGGASTNCVEAEMQRSVLAGVRADNELWSFTVNIQHRAEWPPWLADGPDELLP